MSDEGTDRLNSKFICIPNDSTTIVAGGLNIRSGETKGKTKIIISIRPNILIYAAMRQGNALIVPMNAADCCP